MKNQIKILVVAGAVVLQFGCASDGALDRAMEANAKSKKADYAVMEAEYKKWLKGEGKLTVEAARRFVLPNWLRENQMELHFSDDRFTTELFSYVLAGRTNEIDWTPEQIALLESRTRACQRSKQAQANALVEMAANINTATIDPRTGLPLVQGGRKFDASRITTSGSCNGVDALSFAYSAAIGKRPAETLPKNKLEIE